MKQTRAKSMIVKLYYATEALIKLNRGEEAEDLIKNLLININDSNEENNEIKCKAFYLLSLNELNKDNFNFALELINEDFFGIIKI